ncbi:MAG: hypothetical protein ACI9LO_001740 [Planctomycetota bacterium]|jgi:hypothetical protein
MSVQSSINETAGSIVTALASHKITEEEREMISDIVAGLLVKTVEKTTSTHLRSAENCCGGEVDLAHHIREQFIRDRDLLISNLQAMR